MKREWPMIYIIHVITGEYEILRLSKALSSGQKYGQVLSKLGNIDVRHIVIGWVEHAVSRVEAIHEGEAIRVHGCLGL